MREFLARNEIVHGFEDVRKAPVSKRDTIALIRRYKRAIAKRGAALTEFDPRVATDEVILKAFLGREGTLRAPTVAVGETIVGGFDESTYRKLMVG